MFDDPCLSVHDFKGSHSNVQELTLSVGTMMEAWPFLQISPHFNLTYISLG